MGDGYQLSVSAVTRLADSFAGHQQPVRAIGGPLLDAAGSINTGDPALDAETRDVISRVNELFTLVGDTLGRFSDALNDVVDNYQQGDQQVADSFAELMDGNVPGSTATDAPVV